MTKLGGGVCCAEEGHVCLVCLCAWHVSPCVDASAYCRSACRGVHVHVCSTAYARINLGAFGSNLYHDRSRASAGAGFRALQPASGWVGSVCFATSSTCVAITILPPTYLQVRLGLGGRGGGRGRNAHGGPARRGGGLPREAAVAAGGQHLCWGVVECGCVLEKSRARRGSDARAWGRIRCC